jgi:alpha,alpha-trehalase
LSPDQVFGDLFIAVQTSKLFSDSKTFVDCIPHAAPEQILTQYEAEKTNSDFSLKAFVLAHFTIPAPAVDKFESNIQAGTTAHIHQLWDRLTRPADEAIPYDSRVPLPKPYVVPGGRFREIFYWDSYFTMLGLLESNRPELVRDMIDNFAYLIDEFGYIPNGNRTYFLSRSQPPYFALMIGLLAEVDGPDTLTKYLPQLQREYEFWMDDAGDITKPTSRRTVRLSRLPGTVLNRYWDDTPTPRPEAYREELHLSTTLNLAGPLASELYTHIRAACESGWDFSSRWMENQATMATIRAADIVPVDLNCLLYALEDTLRQAYEHAGQPDQAALFTQLANARKQAIMTLFWDEKVRFFHDYDLVNDQLVPNLTLAGAFPLFFNLATELQAQFVHDQLRANFLQAGGWVTTLQQTGQQWDWPNGWAPLQWIVYKGLTNYNFSETAATGRDNWLALNDRVFTATGKMMEKYNVVDAALKTGGGEYPNQDGFGWTNGVYLQFSKYVNK